ncbi:MAG: hypothetical protein O7G85_12145 [Planctomycetota bacterium]|nr:hypothetical protein [Planctomycetota bacterium]
MPTKNRDRRSFCALIMVGGSIAFLPSIGAAQQPKNPHVLETTTKSVAVFKNGFGFFMREGEVTLRDGWCTAGALPPAAFGTLAIYSHDEHQTVDIVGSGPGEIFEFDGVESPDTPEERRQRLYSCLNLDVQIDYRELALDRTVSGTLSSVDGTYAIVMKEGLRYAVPIDHIQKLQVLDLPLRIHVTDDEGIAPSSQSTLGIAYLRGGITWIPEYTLRVIDEKTIKLTLRGTLVNEAEDIIHGDVNFVVGVPNFAHTDYLAPIVVGQMIRTIGTAIAPAQISMQIATRASFANNANAASQFGVETLSIDSAMGGLDLGLPMLHSAGGSDYTVYTKHDLTVRKGEKAIVTLFEQTIPYSHIYRWTPPGRVQHSLVLQNESTTAWTTGPALAISGSQPLGEDLLKYTPRNGRCEYPVTAAVNVAHQKTEREYERKLKAHSPRRELYLDLVTLEGELKIRNYESQPITLVINVPVPGKPIFASKDGAMSTDSTMLELTKRQGMVNWKVDLKPDETITLKYRYERYVPSN